MTKSLNHSNLHERSAIRTLLVVSLCGALAAFGCTTDRNLGNGDPVVTPGPRSTPTGGTSAGSESEPVPPPMMSSYSGAPRPQIARLSADEAAAIMAQQQQPRVRVLGPVAPGPSTRPYVSDLMLPRQQGEVRYSVNSTLYSGPTEAVTSGAGEAVASTSAAPNFLDNSGVTATGTTSTNVTSTNLTNAAAPVVAPSGTVVTPTSNAVSSPSGFASVRTLSPTAAAVVNPPASISGSPSLATVSSSRTAEGTITTIRTATTTSSTPTSAVVANPVRVVSTSGRLTITNTGTTRQQ